MKKMKKWKKNENNFLDNLTSQASYNGGSKYMCMGGKVTLRYLFELEK